MALVAGATRGAGRGIAVELGASGATVYCTGRSSGGHPSELNRPETIEETAAMVTEAGGRGIAVQVDHSHVDPVRALVDRVEREQDGQMDILVNDNLADLFDGRSQLLAYNAMFGPDYRIGACPGCTSLADGLDGTLVHLHHSDVTLVCFSRAPIERLATYKRRMGWQFPYVSTYGSDFAFDFGLAMTQEQAQQNPELQRLIDDPPDSLRQWAHDIGAELKDGLRENPSWIAFAREGGAVYHTYTVSAPDPFVAPYFGFMLERTPKGGPAESEIRRKDQYLPTQ